MDEWPPLGALESVAILGLSVVFREEYSTAKSQIWYHSVDMHFVLFHVKFEDGLIISVWEKKATCHKYLQLENQKIF
jgi:hypothetical protein